jgi:hypothetical protein
MLFLGVQGETHKALAALQMRYQFMAAMAAH